jgi:hypothetical protein
MTTDNLLKKCKPLITSDNWKDLEVYLTHLIDQETLALINQTEIGNIREIQGKIKTYKHILCIPKKLDAFSN